MMDKNRMLMNQQLKFMIYNFIAFTLIFTIFAVIILSQVQNTLYRKADEEMQNYKVKADDLIHRDSFPPDLRDRDRKMSFNPRMIVLHWNEAGEIMNQAQIGTQFYENLIDGLRMDEQNLDVIKHLSLNNLYNFRTISYLNDHDDSIYITQLLVNVDAEETVIDNFRTILFFCTVIFILLSITASYVLSRKTMKPIMTSWSKQVEFVENASHELRTPLTIIQNKLELLLTKPNEKIVDRFENIALSLSETRRLTKLTTDLLTLARADSTETQFVMESMDIDAFIREACAPYVEIAESQDKTLWMQLDCKMQLEVDSSRIHQLLVILLDNALKYTGENDSIGIKTFYEDHRIVIEISDTGIGIREENVRHIFDRFYREDQARTREKGGFGLGLSIAQWIVSGHQGTIKAIRNESNGTSFIVKLPR